MHLGLPLVLIAAYATYLAWVFAMSCCISSAICCAMITSSMSGVALGYNYSLAEYIDLKETNVSVFMKRGVFDDDISGDMDWRRRGHQPLPLNDDESSLKTGPPDEPEQMPMDSRRRLENSIVESGENIKYEGSLMKLTVKPPHPSHTPPPSATEYLRMQQAVSSFPDGSLDQLKAVQEVINMRKMAAGRDVPAQGQSSNGVLDKSLAGLPEGSRRMSHFNGPGLSPEEIELRRQRPAVDRPEAEGHPARWGIPSGVDSMDNWIAPKMSPEVFRRVFNTDDDPPSFMKPGTYATGPIRPSSTTTKMTEAVPISSKEPQSPLPLPPGDQELDALQANIFGKKYDSDEEKNKEYLNQDTTRPIPAVDPETTPDVSQDIPAHVKNENNIDYYEDDSIMRGLPVRKKRGINKMKLQHRAEAAAKPILQKSNLGVLTKFKLGKGIFNKITDSPSILVSKLHFFNSAESNETTSTINKEERNGTTAYADLTKKDFLKDKVLSVIQSMFS